MKVKIGKCYIATLSKGEAPIRIESLHKDGGWVVRTLLTSRVTRIKTIEQLVRECDESEMEEYTNRSNERPKNRIDAPISEESAVEIYPTTEVLFESETDTSCATSEGTSEDIYEILRRKPKRNMSLLDAAQRVLTEYGDELSANDIVQAALQKGYWQTGGKTPGNSLNAAIAREIKTKGEDSRFTKRARGRFFVRQQ